MNYYVPPPTPPSIPHTHYPVLPPRPPQPKPFSFPEIFEPFSNNDIPSIGKSFAGNANSSSVPKLACAHNEIGTPDFQGAKKITDLDIEIEDADRSQENSEEDQGRRPAL